MIFKNYIPCKNKKCRSYLIKEKAENTHPVLCFFIDIRNS
jgi:hypothetical protein